MPERRWLVQVCNECDELWDTLEKPHRHTTGHRALEDDIELVPAERAEAAESQLSELRERVEAAATALREVDPAEPYPEVNKALAALEGKEGE